MKKENEKDRHWNECRGKTGKEERIYYIDDEFFGAWGSLSIMIPILTN